MACGVCERVIGTMGPACAPSWPPGWPIMACRVMACCMGCAAPIWRGAEGGQEGVSSPSGGGRKGVKRGLVAHLDGGGRGSRGA
eukprot:1011711-Prorocentrum_minimum.AAC.1